MFYVINSDSHCNQKLSSRKFRNAICHKNIILKENDPIVTGTLELCEIFAVFFTVANSTGNHGHIS